MKIILKEKYEKEIAPALMKELGRKNVFAVPRILKVSINSGIGKFLKEKDAVSEISADIKTITGQKPVLTKSKKSISGFKTRQNQEIGVAVTLRGEKMWHFLERLVNVALPRIRDFQGIDKKNIDDHGNLNMALKENYVFPEITPENVKHIFGFQVNVTNTAKTKEEGLLLLKKLGFPMKNE